MPLLVDWLSIALAIGLIVRIVDFWLGAVRR
jgi:hypothetical protein